MLAGMRATGNSALDAQARSQLVTTRTSADGYGAVDALISAPKAGGLGVQTPLTRVMDADASDNNFGLWANTSVMKAIGLTPTYSASNVNKVDGSITFSSAFGFDFDPTNGISAGKMDFLGVAIHEIGHALGFVSGVDPYDGAASASYNLGDYFWMSTLDLFRYSAESSAQGVRDWAVGGTPYFSIDGGKTVYDKGYFSTGRNLGDKQQASHWKDSKAGVPQLGVMDPTSGYGQQQVIDSLDLAAFDAMGWNVAYDVMQYGYRSFSTAEIPGLVTLETPEPGALALVGVGLLGAGLARRRRQA